MYVRNVAGKCHVLSSASIDNTASIRTEAAISSIKTASSAITTEPNVPAVIALRAAGGAQRAISLARSQARCAGFDLVFTQAFFCGVEQIWLPRFGHCENAGCHKQNQRSIGIGAWEIGSVR